MALGILFFPWGVFSLLAAATGPIKTWAALCRIWLLSVLLFFSLPNSKLLGYILPAVPSLVMLAAMGWDKVMLKVKHAERWFGVLVVLNLSLALVGSVFSMKYTSMVLSRDVATVLACQASTSDTIYALNAYPYDLPFVAQVTRPLVVIGDWENLHAHAGDSWQRELFESADFAPVAAQTLQSPEQLALTQHQSGRWLVIPIAMKNNAATVGWTFVFKGMGWVLFRSNPDAGHVTEPASPKGLDGCKK